MNEFRHFRREAQEALPEGYFALPQGEPLRPDDLVWSWSSKEFIRADSPEWRFPCFEFESEVIFAARKVGLSDFEKNIEKKRVFSLNR